jgi:hypothetical protein
MYPLVSSCANPRATFCFGRLGTGLPAVDWLEVPLVEGTVPGLFFLMGGSRFFLKGGRVTVVDSSLAASGRVAEVAALVDDSASSALRHQLSLLAHLETKPRLWGALIRQAGCDPVPLEVAVCVRFASTNLPPFPHAPSP